MLLWRITLNFLSYRVELDSNTSSTFYQAEAYTSFVSLVYYYLEEVYIYVRLKNSSPFLGY